MPETQAGLTFDEEGVCNACRNYEQKKDIDWKRKQAHLEELLSRYRGKDNPYDCIVPFSGGKDSAYTLYMIKKIYKMNPLAVTFNYLWYNNVGIHNRDNTVRVLGVDQIMFTPNEELVKKLSRKSLKMFGDQCWHCHAGVGAWTVQMALQYKIPLMIWSESPAEHPAENPVTFDDYPKADYEHFMTRFVKGYPAEKMADKDIPLKALAAFIYPGLEELKKIDFNPVFLGSYIPWDAKKNVEILKKEVDWQETDYDGCYLRYDRIECAYEPIHDYLKFLKRGFGRSQDRVSIDIRNGVLTREEAIRLVREHDGKKPKLLKEFLDYLGISEEEFMKEALNNKVPGWDENPILTEKVKV
jgi:N-acetyl sugar amidotransferase